MNDRSCDGDVALVPSRTVVIGLRFLFGLVLLLCVCCGCGTLHVYDGDKRPDSALAKIKVATVAFGPVFGPARVVLVGLDGKSDRQWFMANGGNGIRNFAVLPGSHIMFVDCNFRTGGTFTQGNVTTSSPVRNAYCGRRKLTLNAEAGHVYVIRPTFEDKDYRNWRAVVTDSTAGCVVTQSD